jgi:quercetin dioxygenase-like cupin family protein
MTTPYTYLDLSAQLPDIPADSILSRAIYGDDQVKAVLFSFAAGQELSEHTASVPAIIHILRGQARLTLGADSMEASEGAWAHMPANLPHSVLARTPVTMLLLMLKMPKGS